jgi:hypothetical protein
MRVILDDGRWFITPETDFEKHFLIEQYKKPAKKFSGAWFQDSDNLDEQGLCLKPCAE